MDHLIFVLAENPETGDIIDDAFVTSVPLYLDRSSFVSVVLNKPAAESEAFRFCRNADLNLLDYDGPYAVPFFLQAFTLTRTKRKPRWSSLLPPAGIDKVKWSKRGPLPHKPSPRERLALQSG
jgi:hypothetical protein